MHHVLGEEVLDELLPVLDQECLPVRSPCDHVSATILLHLFQNVVKLGREQILEIGTTIGIGRSHGNSLRTAPHGHRDAKK